MWPLRKLLPELVQRLSEAAQPELLPLMTVDGIKKARAAILFKAGYKTVGMVRNSNCGSANQLIFLRLQEQIH